MSNEFNTKIEKLFLSKTKTLQADGFLSLLKESLANSLQEKGELSGQQPTKIATSDIIKFLPKFEFNEKAVGKVDTEERKQFELFMGPSIKAAGNLKQKIQVINSFANAPSSKSNDTQGILSSLMMLKILKNIVIGSSPGPSGLKFEAFFAALFGGNQVEVSAGGAIDVLVGQTKYQLKLLKPKSRVRIARSSIEKLSEDVESAAETPTQPKNALNFIIANKFGNEAVQEVVFYSLENVIPVVKDGRAEYTINPAEYETKEIGRLSITNETFNNLSANLQNNVVKVLTDVTSLVNNINEFYFASDTKAAKKGIDDATTISKDLTEQTK